MQSDIVSGFPSHLLDGLDLSELDAICRNSVKATRQKLKFADLDKEMARAWKTATGSRTSINRRLSISSISDSAPAISCTSVKDWAIAS